MNNVTVKSKVLASFNIETSIGKENKDLFAMTKKQDCFDFKITLYWIFTTIFCLIIEHFQQTYLK